MKLRVRQGFAVHLSQSQVFAPGEEFEASQTQFEMIAHQVEIIDKPGKPTKEREDAIPS